MKINIMQPLARIRAICIVFALLMVPGMVHAYDVYLLTAETINGTTGNYNVPSNHQFTNSSGTVYTYTINSLPEGGFSFRIGVSGWKDDIQPYTNGDALNIDGDSYTISDNCYGKTNAWTVSYTDGEYSSLTITVDLKDKSRYVKITGVKSSTGGGTSTTCTPGLYIAGDKYGKTGDQYIYKLQRNKDKQYYISLNAINGAEWSNVQSYSTGQGMDNYYVKTIGQTYHLVYIDDQGKETDYYPSTNGYTLTGSDTNTGSKKTNDFSTTSTKNWEIGVLNSNDANGGIYNFYVNTDVNGVPQNWYYEADQTKVVAYEVNESTHTTDAYLYCTRANTTGAYKQNFFGMVSFVKDGFHSFLFADKTYGRRQNSNSTYDQDAAADSPNAFQFSKDHLDTGIYTTEFNPTRDYIIAGDPKPTRIFIIGSALNSNLSDTFTDWNPSNATEMVYDVDEGCYKATVTLNKDKQFRFLLDHNESGAATSLDNNFGEDANKPGSGGDTDYNNKVQVESSSSSGENIVFNPETNIYIVRFYVERKADKTGFEWTNDYGIYHYTIEKPERLYVILTPTKATVPFGTSLTPKVDVEGTDNKTRRYAFTLDGTDPVVDAETGKGANNSTKVVSYDYDPVIPTNDLYTFYMTQDNKLVYIGKDANTGLDVTDTLPGNTVTVKVQALYKDESSRLEDPSHPVKFYDYALQGDVVTGTYTFEPAGSLPQATYTLSVTNPDDVSVNKATATVNVTNTTTGSDDGVDVYYTTDGTDPASSQTARLVRDRKVTLYALPGEVGNKGTLKVAIPNTTASASCEYDITYSTSEGGYQSYMNNKTDKLLGGEGHVVVYVKPYFSDPRVPADTVQKWLKIIQPYVYVYEKRADNTHASLTTSRRILTDADKTTVNGETWYALDLVPTSGYKEMNVTVGAYSARSLEIDRNNPDNPVNHYRSVDANVANVCKDVFLKLDLLHEQLVDVTHAYTGDHFYTTGAGGSKLEAANPVSGQPFFYAQVPAAWTSNGNKVKVFSVDKDTYEQTELNGANVVVQNGAETSILSSVCKVSVPETLADGTMLVITPYSGETAGHEQLQISYQNGGYYFYESAYHNTPIAPLVFSADAENDKNLRSYGRHDINHVTTGDKTHYLSSDWTYSQKPSSEKISVEDNWTGSTATVNVIPAGTTIKQEVTGLTAGTPYTVQMIVRGKSGATGKLSLNDATEGTATASKSFTGYDAAGCITTDGRVEALLSGTNNGWQKLEAVAKATDGGTLTISLAATGEELQLSDVTLLDNANTDGHVWTKAPTSNDVTEYDLSDRTKANAFSFFDRGDNKNAIVYANANTVLGMSKNTYDVAVGDGSNYTMQTLALTDQAQDGTTASGDVAKFYASGWNYGVTKDFTASAVQFDRTFSAGVKAAVCFPFALDKNNMETMFGTGAKAYKVTAVDAKEMTVTAEEATSGIAANTPCLLEPGSGYSNKLTGSIGVTKTSGVSLSASAGTGYTFEGTYDYKKVLFDETEHCYSFDPTLNGRFKYVSKSKGGIIKPFRAYIKEADTNASAKVFRLVINSTTTGLVDAELNEVSTAPIYSVTGVLVSANGNRNGLPNGVYIQDGKKFVINK